jgi:hypothetical protein
LHLSHVTNGGDLAERRRWCAGAEVVVDVHGVDAIQQVERLSQQINLMTSEVERTRDSEIDRCRAAGLRSIE